MILDDNKKKKQYEKPVSEIEMFTIKSVLTGLSDESQDPGGDEIEPEF